MRTVVGIFLALALSLAVTAGVCAVVVGRFVEVEGPVDLLKQGQLPVVTPKAQDGLEPGDVIRTKSQGRAQVKFVDDTVLTIAPGSRVAIEAYMYDAAKGSRKAVLQVFRGMVETVVSKFIKTQEPDFIMKTHTAVLGVRGTHWYTLLGPNLTDIYNESGKLCVTNIFAEIKGEVCLKAMEFTRVMFGMTPTVSTPFQLREKGVLKQLLKTGDISHISTGPGTGGQGGGGGALGFVDRFGFLNPQNPATNPTSSLYKPPQILPPRTLIRPEPLVPGGTGGGGTPTPGGS
jgi:hypothetical protein